jgi:thiamine biosynthesis lipoprotein
MEPFVSRHHGLLGTVIELRIEADTQAAALRIEHQAIEEIVRLQSVFNVYDPDSELSRWRRSETEAGPEILEVLGIAERWHDLSEGAFDPYVGRLREVWTDAATEGRVPGAAELAAARLNRDRSSVDLNGIAKGWIVDRATERAGQERDANGVTVNGGGDIRHTGPRPLRVAIENPHRPYNNAAPMAVIELRDGAVATSGGAHRGWTIGDRRHSHVLDPRTGMPAEGVLQVSVLAPSACVADVVATALTVVGVDEREQFLDRMDEIVGYLVGYLIVESNGETDRNQIWENAEVN